MLPKKYRFQDKKTFLKTLKYGRKYRSKHLLLRTLKWIESDRCLTLRKSKKLVARRKEGRAPIGDDYERSDERNAQNSKKNPIASEKSEVEGSGESSVRVGLIILAKFIKGAVKRNKNKRRIREVMRNLINQEGIKNKYSLIFTIFSDTNDMNWKELTEEIRSLLRKAKVLKAKKSV